MYEDLSLACCGHVTSGLNLQAHALNTHKQPSPDMTPPVSTHNYMPCKRKKTERVRKKLRFLKWTHVRSASLNKQIWTLVSKDWDKIYRQDKKKKKKPLGLWRIAQWLRACAALPEDQGLVPRTQHGSQQSNTLFWPLKAPDAHASRDTHTHKISKSKNVLETTD